MLFLLAVLGLYLVGVGAIDDPHGRGIDTYAKHVCRRRRDGGIGACTLTDEELLKRTAKINSLRAMLAP